MGGRGASSSNMPTITPSGGGSGSGGQVFNVEQKNGKLYVYDVQNNKRKSNSAYLKETMQYTTLSHTTLFRTDDATPTDAMRFMVRPSTKK